MLNFYFSEKGLGLVSAPHFVYDFSIKIILILSSINWPNFFYLIAFTSQNIGQYVYCNCLLTRLWRHKFWNYSFPSNQAVLLHDQKNQDKKLNILRMKRAFEVKWKAFFIIFKGLSVAKNCLRPENAPLSHI